MSSAGLRCHVHCPPLSRSHFGDGACNRASPCICKKLLYITSMQLAVLHSGRMRVEYFFRSLQMFSSFRHSLIGIKFLEAISKRRSIAMCAVVGVLVHCILWHLDCFASPVLEFYSDGVFIICSLQVKALRCLHIVSIC